MTAQYWKDAPAYLYSFEHSGGLNRGFSFLQGSPLIGNASIGKFGDCVKKIKVK